MTKAKPFSFRTIPLRVAGQGVQEQIAREHDGLVEEIGVFALVLSLVAMEWFRYFRPAPPHPWLVTVLAFVIIGVIAFRLQRKREKFRQLALGRDGERLVAEHLDALRAKQFRVFHDVVADGFNIDHVLIGPTGVFAIETKARAKEKGEEIEFDGKRCFIGNRPMRDDPIVQAKRQAKWLAGFLRSATGHSYSVTPVLTFPQWYINRTSDVQDIRVLSPRELYCLAEQPTRLSNAQVIAIAFQVEQLVRRAQERELT